MGNCLNCGQEITGNYCSNCGQKKYRRIDRKYIIEEAQYSLLHTNKGFLYSVKNILKNPGKTARDFIEGNRVNHYKPILLAFVLSGISAFISFKLVGFSEMMKNIYAENNLSSKLLDDYLYITTTYNSFIMLGLVPIYALMTKIAFYKWGNNYFEHIVMNAFTVSFYTIVNILFIYPLLFMVKSNNSWVYLITCFAMLFIPFMLVWFYKGFYSNKKIVSIIFRILLVIFMLSIVFTILMFVTMIMYFVLNPEALQQMQELQQKT